MTRHRGEFSADLAMLKRRSPHSYKVLAQMLDRPISTVHGWCTGKHLPYSRDNEAFDQLLQIFGLTDQAERRRWLHNVANLRSAERRAEERTRGVSLDPFVTVTARTWHQHGRDPAGLLRGPMLRKAQQSLERADGAVDSLSREFIEASTAGELAEQRHGAEVLSRQIAMQAALIRPTDQSLSAQLAVVAHRLAPTIESRSEVLAASAHLPGPRAMFTPGQIAVAVDGADDGVIVLNAPRGSATELVVADDGSVERRLFPLPDGADVLSATRLAADDVLFGRVDGSVECASLERHMGTWVSDRVTGPIRALQLDERGERLAVAGAHGVAIWEWERPDLDTHRLVGHLASVGDTIGVAWSDDGERIATAGMDGRVLTWRCDDLNQPEHELLSASSTVAGCVCFTNRGDHVVVGRHNGEVRVWADVDTTVPRDVSPSSTNFGTWVNSLDVSPDGLRVAAASSDGSVRLWNTASWQEVGSALRHPAVVTSARFRSDSTLITACEDGGVRQWTLPEPTSDGSDDTIWTLDVVGSTVLTSSRSRTTVFELDRDGLVESRRLERDDAFVDSGTASLSPDGRMAVVGTREGLLFVTRVDATASEASRTIRIAATSSALIEGLAWRESGGLVAAVDRDGSVQLGIVAGDGGDRLEQVGSVSPPGLALTFADHGQLLVVTSEDTTATVFELDDRMSSPMPHVRRRSSFSVGASFTMCVAPHPSLPIVACGNADRTTSLWDLSDPASPGLVARLDDPGGHVMALAFSPDGSRLAGGSTDGRLWLWNVADPSTPFALASIPSGELGVYAVAFTSDGSTVLGAGTHQVIHRWTLEEAAACERILSAVGDRISKAEWARLIPPALPFRRL